MKKYLKKSLITLVIILCFISCKKDNEDENISKTDLLTSKAWVMLKNELQQQPTATWIDFWPSEPACERDNKWIFKKDLSLELNESLLPCNGTQANQEIDVLRWTFANNENEIDIDNVVFKIEVLNESSFIISRSENISGIVSSLKMTYGH